MMRYSGLFWMSAQSTDFALSAMPPSARMAVGLPVTFSQAMVVASAAGGTPWMSDHLTSVRKSGAFLTPLQSTLSATFAVSASPPSAGYFFGAPLTDVQGTDSTNFAVSATVAVAAFPVQLSDTAARDAYDALSAVKAFPLHSCAVVATVAVSARFARSARFAYSVNVALSALATLPLTVPSTSRSPRTVPPESGRYLPMALRMRSTLSSAIVSLMLARTSCISFESERLFLIWSSTYSVVAR